MPSLFEKSPALAPPGLTRGLPSSRPLRLSTLWQSALPWVLALLPEFEALGLYQVAQALWSMQLSKQQDRSMCYHPSFPLLCKLVADARLVLEASPRLGPTMQALDRKQCGAVRVLHALRRTRRLLVFRILKARVTFRQALSGEF